MLTGLGVEVFSVVVVVVTGLGTVVSAVVVVMLLVGSAFFSFTVEQADSEIRAAAMHGIIRRFIGIYKRRWIRDFTVSYYCLD